MPKRLVLEVSPMIFAQWKHKRVQANVDHGMSLADSEFLEYLLRGAPVGDGKVVPPGFQIAIDHCPECRTSHASGGGAVVDITRAEFERASCDAIYLGDVRAEKPPRKTQSFSPRMREQISRATSTAARYPAARTPGGWSVTTSTSSAAVAATSSGTGPRCARLITAPSMTAS